MYNRSLLTSLAYTSGATDLAPVITAATPAMTIVAPSAAPSLVSGDDESGVGKR